MSISTFDSTFGYYAHGLPPESCPLPKGWEKRLVQFRNANTHGITALCLDPVDLAASKLSAGREKDREFVAEMLRHKLIGRAILESRVELLEKADQRAAAEKSLEIVATRLSAARL